MKLFKFAFLLLSLILVSCSQGSGKTNVKISLAAISGSENFPGGLFLYGKNKSIPEMGFARKVNADDSLELELENGDWGFVVMGWDGSNFYEGNSFCDAMERKLDGAEVSLSFEATRAKCSPRFINGTDELYNGFYSLKIHTCAGIQEYISSGQPIPSSFKCDGSMDIFNGGMKSFKVFLAEYMPEKGESFSSESRCLTTVGSETPASVNIPLGSEKIKTAVVIKGYSDTSCHSEVKKYIFRDGIRFAEDHLNAAAVLDSTTKTVNLFAHADLCNEGQKNSSPFAASSDTDNDSIDDTHLICTPNQFQYINIYPADSFILGADIDMSGVTKIANTFEGNFDGQNFKLYDGVHPIFQEVSANSSDIKIENLVIDNFQISYGFAPSTNTLGILANQSFPGGGKTEITNITVNSNNKIEISVPDGGTISTTTYLGGLVGHVQTSSGGKFEAREIAINGLVKAHDQQVVVGGVFGILKAGAGESPKIESSRVGSSSQRMMIQGYQKVGGIAGQIHDAEVVQKTIVLANLKGKDYVGGIVGDALDNTQISDVKTDIIYLPLSTTNSRVGGVVGGIAGDFSVSIEGVVSNFTVPTPTDPLTKVDKLGGIVGHRMDNTASANSLRIMNSKTFVDFHVDGQEHGGFIGYHYNNSGISGEILNSVALGRMLESSRSAGNNTKGGFAGFARFLDVKRSVSLMDTISGDSYIGGGIGEVVAASISEAKIDSNLECLKSSADIYCGGLIGFNDNTVGYLAHSDLMVKAEINISNFDIDGNGGCSAQKCGGVVGYNSSNANLAFNKLYIEDLNILDQQGDIVNLNDGAGDVSAGTHIDNLQADGDTTCNGSLLGKFDNSHGIFPSCGLLFEKQWRTYGFAGEYLAGNWIEPFKIHSAAEWNEIKDDAFLVQQTFKLMDDLDFISGLFEPIGSISNPFSGRIIPNGKTLKRINFTAGNDNAGIFNATGNGASIGWYNDPLKIFDMTIDCTSQLNCGVIGQAQDTNLFVVVKDGDVYGTGDNYGGLVGLGVERISINNSGYEGKVHGNSKVGGLVGFLSNGGSGGDHLIKNSFVRAKLIQADGGSSYSGGFVGLINLNNEELEIENSYLKFINTGIDNFKGDIAGLLMGGMNSGYKLKNVFANTKYLSLASGTTLYKGAWNLGSATDNGRSYTLVEPVARGYSVSSTAMDPNFPLVSREADLNTDMYRRDGGGSEWYQDVNGEVYLAWEKALGLK